LIVYGSVGSLHFALYGQAQGVAIQAAFP